MNLQRLIAQAGIKQNIKDVMKTVGNQKKYFLSLSSFKNINRVIYRTL
jgi:hypothetical protein